ncbi:MAG: FAD binding domain-containing protein, partial [Ruminococcus sp.]|nr:FAD binding domain-containing protein [Ruminococcus sp.]
MYDLKALYEATSVEHAVQLRMEHPEAQIIAGGSDVLVQMREGKRAGKELISIYKIDSMRGISYEEDGA